MLRFFKVNDPLRLLGILLFVVLLRLPYLWLGLPVLQPEMIWMLIGERMHNGYAMYSEIVDDTGPFSALLYWAIYTLFGRSFSAFQVVASLIIFFQVIYLNFLFLQFKSYQESSYLPAIVMLALFHLSYDFLTLSPSLMGNTFILLAFGQLFSQTAINRSSTESVLLLGLFGGISLCFHFPLIVFFPVMVICSLFISRLNFQQFLLSVTAYFIPFSLYALYAFWTDSFGEFFREFVLASRMLTPVSHTSYQELVTLFSVPFLLSLVGLVLTFGLRKMYVNQQKQSQLMMLYFLCSCSVVFLANRTISYQFLGFIPVFTYFMVHLFWSIKSKYIQPAVFYCYLLIIPALGYAWVYRKMAQPNELATYAIVEPTHSIPPSGAPILVLGDDLGYYLDARPATPFIHYGLAKQYLLDLDDFGKKTKIFYHFMNERPEYIMDQEGVFESILPYFPPLALRYERISEHVYRLKSNTSDSAKSQYAVNQEPFRTSIHSGNRQLHTECLNAEMDLK